VLVGPASRVGANQDLNSQTPAPARLARNPAERAVAREDAVLDVLPPGLDSTGGPFSGSMSSTGADETLHSSAKRIVGTVSRLRQTV
jgi:hypothetical protein